MMRSPARSFVVRCVGIALLLSALPCAGCGASTPEADTPERPVRGVARGADLSRCEFKDRQDRVYTETRGPGARFSNIFRIYEVSLDSKQGKRTLLCRQVDTNLDGIRDVIRTYTSEGEALDEQSDSDYDGTIDTWIRFSRGRVLRESRDNNRDGKPDEFRIYSDGKLSRLQRDSDFDGKLDRWHVYDGRRLHRVGVDLDGDQRVDRWYRDAELKRLEQEEAEREGAADPQTLAPGAAAAGPDSNGGQSAAKEDDPDAPPDESKGRTSQDEPAPSGDASEIPSSPTPQ